MGIVLSVSVLSIIGDHRDFLQEHRPGLWQKKDFTGEEGQVKVVLEIKLHQVLA